MPRAVILAVLLVLGLELALHMVPVRWLLGYGEGLGTYYEVLHSIEEYGAAEVAILGSSRGQESVVMPMLDGMLEDDLSRSVYTANYSCPDAKTSEMLLVVQKLFATPVPPRVVLYIISPRALLGDERSIQREDVFGVFPDEYGHSTGPFLASLSEKPLWAVRNFMQRNWLTFRYRYRFRNLMASLPRGRRPLSPVQGEETTWQKYAQHRSLLTSPISDKQIGDYVARLLDADGNYVLGQSRVQALGRIAEACNAGGAKLVLVAAPISDDLARHLPAGVLDEYSERMNQLARDYGVPFVTCGGLGISFGREDFREQSHLNRQGAEKMTKALVEQVLEPRLEVER